MALLFRRTTPTTGDLSIAGPRTRALFKTTDDVPLVLALQLAPAAASAFLGVPADALTDRVVRLEEVWAGEAHRLLDSLLERTSREGPAREPRSTPHAGRPSAPGGRDLGPSPRSPGEAAGPGDGEVSAALDVLAGALRSRAARTPPNPGALLARRAVHMLEAPSGAGLRVEAVAAALGVSSRHLRRVFADNVGVGPKELARMLRLQRALALAGAGSGWAEIAGGAGYCDQAHLIDDFRDLLGVTPRAFEQRDAAVEWGRRCLTA